MHCTKEREDLGKQELALRQEASAQPLLIELQQATAHVVASASDHRNACTIFSCGIYFPPILSLAGPIATYLQQHLLFPHPPGMLSEKMPTHRTYSRSISTALPACWYRREGGFSEVTEGQGWERAGTQELPFTRLGALVQRTLVNLHSKHLSAVTLLAGLLHRFAPITNYLP